MTPDVGVKLPRWSDPEGEPRLPPGLTLRLCRLDNDGSIGLAEAAACLSADEAERAAGFRFIRDRERFIRARGFLRRELGAALGCLPAEVPLRVTPQGKPVLAEPSAPGFNLSHSAGLAALALNDAGPVGIDLEALELGRGCASLIDSCLTEAEARALQALPPEAREAGFLACWTAKEAAVKLTGTGWAVAPRSVELRLAGGRPVEVLTPPARLRPINLPGYLCHVALPPFAQGRR